MNENDQFYRQRFFEDLQRSIADTNAKIVSMQKDVTDIKAKIAYIYGFAAAIGLLTSLIGGWIKSKFFTA